MNVDVETDGMIKWMARVSKEGVLNKIKERRTLGLRVRLGETGFYTSLAELAY